MSAALSSIAVNMPAEARFFMMSVLRRIKQEYGAAIHVYCTTPETVAFYKSQNEDGLFASINFGALLLATASESVANPDDIIARARVHERRIGCTYNTLAVCHRHFGRGYALGGFYHPRSRYSEHTSYLQMVSAYNTYFDFWEREITDKGIGMIIGGPKESARVAAAHGIPYRALCGSRFKNYHFWSPNEYYENPDMARVFGSLADEPGENTIEEPYLVEQAHRKRFVKQVGLVGLGKEVAHLIARRVYWRLRGYAKAKGYYGRDEVYFALRRWRDTRRMTGPGTVALADIRDRPFVFFPLHTEPEASLGQFSPEYFYQLSAIAALSRDLPAGVRLAVKETIHGVGRRPDNFYDQLRAFKNVVLLDMMEHGLEVVREAAAVATITGTAGFEGAVMGKPVISFGRHNIYRILSHVYTITDEVDLKEYLANVFSGAFDSECARRDGSRYLRAVVASSFDMGEYDYVNLHSYAEANVEAAYRALVESLEDEAPPRMAATGS